MTIVEHIGMAFWLGLIVAVVVMGVLAFRRL